ncbi:MAG: DUF2723 domain-containing protein [Muribaculaceae bacterium]|nr:DUF2723 domain-containing protein [Muribaculaceae bacterium]
MKRYNLINNSLGWLMFAIAAVTYLLTIEPTASFWDCGEFISQGYKLEIGHPPGNPIFMLAARFFINFSSDPSTVAICVNVMSALLSAATILLLFWTITHLVHALIGSKDNDLSAIQLLIIFASGVCGALAYTWSDTFWFSAVEGEVYAFSSFCTALVFWLILKWENKADSSDSDKYLILIAYVIGISVAVHLLNLLCIPAIVLVFYYRKWKNTNVKGSLIALLISFTIIAFILYGLVPGFVEVAQWFELFCVNTLGMSFNSGVVIYLLLDVALFIWSISELYLQKSALRIKISFALSILCSGMLFIGDGWFIPVVLTAILLFYLFKMCKTIPTRVFSLIIMSIVVIFIGYSSYALIIIRSSAHTPMDQNSPDNVFALSSYLNREQYGQRPLIYGQTFNSQLVYVDNGTDVPRPLTKQGKKLYAKKVKATPDEADKYEFTGYNEEYIMSPETDMLFPRMYDSKKAADYKSWTGMTGVPVNATTRVNSSGDTKYTEEVIKPTFIENMKFFIDYQLNYMYWRYFLWNFAGRQNDVQGNGEIHYGNWISGIPFIDNARLGDQSLLPSDLGSNNKGHNVFYMLPLILGIIGLLWQAYKGKRGIEQFWVIFFLFFMTGIAIVIYLNQTTGQPRERDYAFAGSFYAYAIWIGMGVAGIWQLIRNSMRSDEHKANKIGAAVATVIGILVPLQMVSQTWDDHDRSGRYAARDFGMNYLSSVGDNGIIFTNGDNDTFPLWYAQEVEGYRTDVRVVNLSYLSTDWYINQMRRQAYESEPLSMMANDSTFAYDNRQYNYFISPDKTPVTVSTSLEHLYSDEFKNNPWKLPMIKYPVMYQPVIKDNLVANNIIDDSEMVLVEDSIDFNMLADGKPSSREGAMSSSAVASLDIIASNANEGWKRPIYFAMTVPDNFYLGLNKYLRSTGLALELVPIKNSEANNSDFGVNTDKMYENVMTKFRWGGLDSGKDIYVDETVGRMVSTHRRALLDLANALIDEGLTLKIKLDNSPELFSDTALVASMRDTRYEMARNVLNLMLEKLPVKLYPFGLQTGYLVANTFLDLGKVTDSEEDTAKGLELLENEIMTYAEYFNYYNSLSPNLYSRLGRNDYYAHRTYFPALLSMYGNIVGEAAYKEIVMRLITEKGVDMNAIAAMGNNN